MITLLKTETQSRLKGMTLQEAAYTLAKIDGNALAEFNAARCLRAMWQAEELLIEDGRIAGWQHLER